MNEYSGLRKQNKRSTCAAVIALMLCVILTTIMLVSRLAEFTAPDTQHYIPLTKSTGTTRVKVSRRQADSGVTYDSRQNTASTVAPLTARVQVSRQQAGGSVSYNSLQNMHHNGAPLTANPGFRTYDENTVWSGETDVQIFCITYDNDSGETTVRSQDGVKVLAPGTGNSYHFTLENTGNVPLEYTMEMDAWFSHGEYPIPIYASVTDYEGSYLLGSDTQMVDVLRLKEVHESGTIDVGYLQPYTLNWEWPFELDDAYDTMLGNLAVDTDITLTVAIRTSASYYDGEDPGGTPPKTGDESQVLLYGVMLALSLAGLLMLLAMELKEREKKHA